MTIPAALKQMHESTFGNCGKLNTIWVEEGCQIDVRRYVQ